MDELLKRLAKERREKSGPDFELHPVTRRILQNEVARSFPQTNAKAKPPFFFWPRLALMGAFTALLALALTVLNTPRKSKPAFELSKRSDQPASPAPEPIQLAAKEKKVTDRSVDEDDFLRKQIPPTATVPLLSRENIAQKAPSREGNVVTKGGRAEDMLSEPRSLGTPAEQRTDQLADRKLATDRAPVLAALKPESATTAPAVAARSLEAAPAPAAAPVQNYSDPSQLDRRSFVQQDLRARFRQNLLSPPPSKILQSFEVVRAGNRIQLFDSDGSVYEGEILTTTNLLAGKKDFQNPGSLSSAFAFRAAGTNQQLHRFITVNGNFALTNAILVSTGRLQAKSADALKPGVLKGELGTPGKVTGSIRGKISIGGTNEFEIQAIEFPR